MVTTTGESVSDLRQGFEAIAHRHRIDDLYVFIVEAMVNWIKTHPELIDPSL